LTASNSWTMTLSAIRSRCHRFAFRIQGGNQHLLGRVRCVAGRPGEYHHAERNESAPWRTLGIQPQRPIDANLRCDWRDVRDVASLEPEPIPEATPAGRCCCRSSITAGQDILLLQLGSRAAGAGKRGRALLTRGSGGDAAGRLPRLGDLRRRPDHIEGSSQHRDRQ
jgi:hypothetical protein